MIELQIVIICLILLNLAWSYYWTRVLAGIVQGSAFDVAEGVVELDKNLTETVAKLQAGELFQDLEPPSPLAAMFAEVLREKMMPKNSFQVLEPKRDAEGLFTSEKQDL